MSTNELRTDELTTGARVVSRNMTRFTVDSVTPCAHDYRFHARQADGSYITETGMEIVGHDDAGEDVAFTAGQSCVWYRDDTPLAAPAAKPEPVDYASRFAALDSDVLFDLENQAGDMDAPQAHIESLLIVLADWRPRVVAMLADAPEWAVPEAAAYRRALDRTREAWTQYSFRWEGGPELPYPFDLPESVAVPTNGTANVARIESAGRRTLTLRTEVAA